MAAALTSVLSTDAEAEPADDMHPADIGQPNVRLPVPLAHTDWLHHRLAVFGPDDAIAAFQAAAAGTAIVSWQIDLDSLAED